jgi:phosphoribosylaminoimidazolecarboxamide formyltransferase / IMP cyclohydrolase
MDVTIKRALISVSDKSGLEALAAGLARHGVELVSTGGTAAALRSLGHDVSDVAAVTGSPEMMDGRVKTLHPRIHGGLLALRDDPGHMAAMADNGIVPIDLAVINLYPFAETVAKGATPDAIIENIDIGGPAMLRSAAKNHHWVTTLCDPGHYGEFIARLDGDGGTIDAAFRRRMAAVVFQHLATYDQRVALWCPMSPKPRTPSRRCCRCC